MRKFLNKKSSNKISTKMSYATYEEDYKNQEEVERIRKNMLFFTVIIFVFNVQFIL